jgi:hypothetical protein
MNFIAVSQSPEPADAARGDGCGDVIMESICDVMAAEAFLVDVGLEDVGGLIRVVLDINGSFPDEW